MPIYEYRCGDCGRKTTVLTLRASEKVDAKCERCGGGKLTRLMSRFALLRSEDDRLDDLADPSSLGNLDENDPKSMARWMRKMGKERGALHWAGELVRDTLAQGVARRRGEGLLRSRRGEVEVSASCAPLHDGDGTVAGAVLVLRDLTLQRALEATGRRAERLAGLGSVALGLAHEIKNPLGGIKGAAQLLLVVVEDTGPGVPPDDVAQLFSPFFSTKASGSGLGLALCHRIVTEHGGTIAHEPRPGGGARFRVSLPVSEGDVGDTSR